MQNYKLLLQYDGTSFSGWQKQGNTDNTIQGKIERVLSEFAGYPVDVNGAGRTDAGVHAEGQCASFTLREKTEPKKIMEYLIRFLPESIGIIDISYVPARFHARLSATGKTYRYRIRNTPKANVFVRRFVADYIGDCSLELMQEAAVFLVGEHDFAAFCGNKHMKKSTVRTVYSIDITGTDDEIQFLYRGNGFLMYMVRILTGTLLEIGMGKYPPEHAAEVLNSLKRENAGPAAPAKGLCLMEVTY